MVTASLAPELSISQNPKTVYLVGLDLKCQLCFLPAIRHKLFLNNFQSEFPYKLETKEVTEIVCYSFITCRLQSIFFDS